MKLVVGLGNPGREYAGTRHNIGAGVVEALARRGQIDSWKEKFSGLTADGVISGSRALLLRPMTYMNRSGKSVLAAAQFYQCQPADILIVSDDVDLPLGKLRMRSAGSAGGQRGLDDIIRSLGTQDIPRLRIGVGRPARGDLASYVLSTFDESERPQVDEIVQRGANAVECWLKEGINAAMNSTNRDAADDE